jgi:predicted kinase
MIILIFGLPGTGKTFFSEHLAEATGAVHLNTDIIRMKMGKQGVYDEHTNNLVYMNLLEQTADYLSNCRDVIVDGTFLKKEQRTQVREVAQTSGHHIYFIEILADEKIVEERLKGKRKFSEADLEIYRKLKKEYEPFSGNRLELWSDREELETMLEKAKKYIHE